MLSQFFTMHNRWKQFVNERTSFSVYFLGAGRKVWYDNDSTAAARSPHSSSSGDDPTERTLHTNMIYALRRRRAAAAVLIDIPTTCRHSNQVGIAVENFLFSFVFVCEHIASDASFVTYEQNNPEPLITFSSSVLRRPGTARGHSLCYSVFGNSLQMFHQTHLLQARVRLC